MVVNVKPSFFGRAIKVTLNENGTERIVILREGRILGDTHRGRLNHSDLRQTVEALLAHKANWFQQDIFTEIRYEYQSARSWKAGRVA